MKILLCTSCNAQLGTDRCGRRCPICYNRIASARMTKANKRPIK